MFTICQYLTTAGAFDKTKRPNSIEMMKGAILIDNVMCLFDIKLVMSVSLVIRSITVDREIETDHIVRYFVDLKCAGHSIFLKTYIPGFFVLAAFSVCIDLVAF